MISPLDSVQTSLSSVPCANRVRIVFLGRRNAGKSTLINALARQQVAIVSDVPGTTTDPVSKAMEILPLGPCLVTDTAGLDDVGRLGAERVARSLAVLETADIAVLVIRAGEACGEVEQSVREACARRKVALVTVRSQCDLAPVKPVFDAATGMDADGVSYVAAVNGEGVDQLRRRIAATLPQESSAPLVADLAARGDYVVCVCPVDAAAPKGRLILPQQQVVRELLEIGAVAVVCQPAELAATIDRLGAAHVRFVITDSQAFEAVAAAVPPSVPLTSFSIVFARQKGDLAAFAAGAAALSRLRDGDKVLISEGCTHHRQCGDIGTVKLPAWIARYTGKRIEYVFSSGGDFPVERERPALVVHCGGCMLTRRAMLARMERAAALGVPIVNYGVAIALMHGIVADPATCMVKRSCHA